MDRKDIIKSLFKYAKRGDTYMITHIMSHYHDQIGYRDIGTTLCSVSCEHSGITIYLLDIYRRTLHSRVPNSVLLFQSAKKAIKIENCLNNNINGIMPPEVLHDMALIGNLAIIQILTIRVGQFVDFDSYVEAACDYGHLGMFKFFSDNMAKEYRVMNSAVNKGYKGVSQLFINRDKRIDNMYYRIRTVNKEVLILLEHNRIDHECFDKSATRELLKLGYVINNKYV